MNMSRTALPGRILLFHVLAVAALSRLLAGDPPDPFPMPRDLDANEVAISYDRLRKTPLGDPELAYEIGIRKRWTDISPDEGGIPNYHSPVTVGYWRKDGASEREPEVRVSCVLLPFPTAPEAWLTAACDRWKLQIVKKTTLRAGGSDVPDVLARTTLNDRPWIFRLSARLDQERLFLIACCATESTYARHARDFATAVLSFRLLRPVRVEPILLRPVPLPRPVEVRLSLPTGWGVEPESPAKQAHESVVLQPLKGGLLNASFRMYVAVAPLPLNAETAAAQALEDATAEGFVSESVLGRRPVLFPGLPEGEVLLVEGTTRDGPMELRVFTFASADRRVTVSGLCPSYFASRRDWRTGCRSLERVVGAMELPAGAATGAAPPAAGPGGSAVVSHADPGRRTFVLPKSEDEVEHRPLKGLPEAWWRAHRLVVRDGRLLVNPEEPRLVEPAQGRDRGSGDESQETRVRFVADEEGRLYLAGGEELAGILRAAGASGPRVPAAGELVVESGALQRIVNSSIGSAKSPEVVARALGMLAAQGADLRGLEVVFAEVKAPEERGAALDALRRRGLQEALTRVLFVEQRTIGGTPVRLERSADWDVGSGEWKAR